MFHILSRSRRLAALLAAGVLGIAPVMAAPAVASNTATHSVSADRAKEIQAELAWMSDPLTFRCPLHARSAAGSLEVSGSVPNAEARVRAIKLAHDACGTPVRDTVAIRRTTVNGVSPAPHADLLRGANRVVAEALASRASGAEIGVGGQGQVFLRGQGLSWEDRHAASVRLRLVPGCSCVINTLDSADSPHKPAAVPQLIPPAAAKVVPAPRTTANPTPKPLVERTAWVSPYSCQGETAVKETAVRSASNKPPQARFNNTAVSPYGWNPAADTSGKDRTTRTQAMTPSVKNVAPELAPEYVAVDVSAPPSSSMRTFSKPSSEAVVVDERPAPRGLFTLFKRQAPAKAKPVPMALTSVKDRVYMSPSEQAHSAGHPKAVSLNAEEETVTLIPEYVAAENSKKASTVLRTVSKPVSTSQVVEDRPASRGLFTLFSRHTPSKIKSVETARAALPNRPYMSMGTVIFHDEDVVRVSGEGMPSLASAETLRRSVMMVCGSLAADVAVKPREGGGTQVTVRTTSPNAIDTLYGKLVQLPEMQSPQVHLKFVVTH